MTRSAKVWTVTLCVALALGAPATSATAGEGERTDAPTESEKELSPFIFATGGKSPSSGAKAYSNVDLERMFGAAPPPAEAPAASGAGATGSATDVEPAEAEPPAEAKSALDQLLERRTFEQERAQKVADAEQRVADARQRIADLERRVLAVKNPFLARPAAPEEGAEEWAQGDEAQRLKQAEDQLQAARDGLAEAERELTDLRSSTP